MVCAQLIHAAGESSDGKLRPGTYAVALGVETENELRALADELATKGVPVHRVEESTGKYAGQLMALGIEPGPKSVRGKHLSNLPLVRLGDFVEHIQHMTGQEMRRKELRRTIAVCEEKIRELESSWWQRVKKWGRRNAAIPSVPSQQGVK